ncbi:MAG: flagellar filament capping protein FliD, partial [Polyangiaceae bacterium]
GMDVEGLIAGLTKANSVTLSKLQNQASSYRTAASTLSDIGSALASLQTAANALSSNAGVGGMTATSSETSIVASAAGGALAGSYDIVVDTLAAEQRTYSKRFDSNSGALGQAGNFTLKVGSGDLKTINVLASDSLDQIAGKINQAGIRASASVFFDGSKYRLQVRGLDTGADNAITMVENGTTLDLNGDGSDPNGGKTVQAAKNSKIIVDGFTIERSSNQIIGALPGVTLALTKTTNPATPVKVTVGSEPNALQQKLTAVVNAFNNVMNKSRNAAGWGTKTANVTALAGDSALRTISGRLTSAMSAKGFTTGAYQTLQDIGLSFDRNGLMTLDSAKLSKAMATDSATVVNLMAKTTGVSTGGLMAKLSDAVSSITDPTNGVLTVRNESFTKQAKKIDERAVSEQLRLDSYSDRLRKSLGDMDAEIGADKVLLQALTSTFNSNR